MAVFAVLHGFLKVANAPRSTQCNFGFEENEEFDYEDNIDIKDQQEN
jgi:hypothetical protein